MSEMSDLNNRLERVERVHTDLGRVQTEQGHALTRLATTVEGSLASREWVKELVAPIVENTRETRHLVELHTRETRALVEAQGRDTQALHGAHNKLLEERSIREKEEHAAKMAAIESESAARVAEAEAGTLVNIIKNRWAPIAAFVVAASVLLTKVLEFLASR